MREFNGNHSFHIPSEYHRRLHSAHDGFWLRHIHYDYAAFPYAVIC